MNLAEIRKKAKKGQGKEKGGESPVPVPAAGVLVSSGEFPEELAFPPEEGTADGRVVVAPAPLAPAPVVAPASAPVAVVAHEARSSKAFDPLTVLLAGRERALRDEEEAQTVTVQDELACVWLREFLCFRVANETYAVSIMEIKEIIKPRVVTEVPRVPEFVSGVLSLRGIIIPVFHMRHRLGLPPAGSSGRERIVVVKQGEGFCGLYVDEVIQVVKIAAEGIEQPPAVLDGIDRDFVSGIGRHDGRMLILLNLDKILDVSLS